MTMADDRNDWVPKFDIRQDGGTVTQVPQSDGTIKYFLGNYDEKGQLDRVRVNSPGKYKSKPTVQLVDANGDNVNQKGAEFRVVHKNHAELAYVTSTITEVEVVTE